MVCDFLTSRGQEVFDGPYRSRNTYFEVCAVYLYMYCMSNTPPSHLVPRPRRTALLTPFYAIVLSRVPRVHMIAISIVQ